MYMLYYTPDIVHIYVLLYPGYCTFICCIGSQMLYSYMLYCTPDTVHIYMLYWTLDTVHVLYVVLYPGYCTYIYICCTVPQILHTYMLYRTLHTVHVYVVLYPRYCTCICCTVTLILIHVYVVLYSRYCTHICVVLDPDTVNVYVVLYTYMLYCTPDIVHVYVVLDPRYSTCILYYTQNTVHVYVVLYPRYCTCKNVVPLSGYFLSYPEWCINLSDFSHWLHWPSEICCPFHHCIWHAHHIMLIIRRIVVHLQDGQKTTVILPSILPPSTGGSHALSPNYSATCRGPIAADQPLTQHIGGHSHLGCRIGLTFWLFLNLWLLNYVCSSYNAS